ncbi:hypothetical protein IPJ72_02770 [Candidatus Peregrinibacteria bacterium]|nr:MAG: hypothetical protein IPJ72_02770 [Candidatus Peregrinibacteria bacterium]
MPARREWPVNVQLSAPLPSHQRERLSFDTSLFVKSELTEAVVVRFRMKWI